MQIHNPAFTFYSNHKIQSTRLLRGDVWLRMAGALYHKPVLRGSQASWCTQADLLLPQKPVPPPSASYQLYPLQHNTLGFSSLTSGRATNSGHQEVITHSGNSSFQNLLLLVSGKLICATTISENFPCNMENIHLSSFGADKR